MSSGMDQTRSDRLVALCHRRWAIPALAALHRDRGSKFVTLQRRLGSSQGAMRDALDHLIDLGYVRRPGGRGHPLRPEYELTNAGLKIGEGCEDLQTAIDRAGVADTCAKKWSLPVIDAVNGQSQARFGDVRGSLTSITDRALSMALRTLDEAALVTRRVVDQFPPVPVYLLTPECRPISRVLRSSF